MSDAARSDAPSIRPFAVLAPLGVGAALLGLMAIAASIGEPTPGSGLAVTLEAVARGVPVTLAWLGGAIGLGRLVQRAIWPAAGLQRKGQNEAQDDGGAGDRASACRSWAVATGLGVASMLFIAHLLGVLGGLRPGVGLFIAWAPVALGACALVLEAVRAKYTPDRLGSIPWAGAAALPALALIIVAAAAPPGTRWSSEAFGYDVLSYHLQLVKEWLAVGRLVPLEHCVYSFLPSYSEGAYVQVAAMLGTDARSFGEGDPGAIVAAQMLHAGTAVAASIAVASLAWAFIARAGAQGRTRLAGAIAASLTLSVPWVIVCGSLAYTEMHVLLLLAVGARILVDHHSAPLRCGLACGVCLGAACAAKLTAALTGVVPLALAALVLVPRGRWSLTVLGTFMGGAIVSAPWLVRNAIAVGNPVFPWMTRVFGSGHWSGEQVERFHRAHAEQASIAERLATLFSADRGMFHPQWSIFFPLVALALVVVMFDARLRRAAIGLALMLAAQLMMWLTFGHLQSRFLMPALVPGVVIVALAAWSLLMRASSELPSKQPRRVVVQRVLTVALSLLPLALSAHAWLINARENPGADGKGRPNAGLFAGAAILNGSALRAPLQAGAVSLETRDGVPTFIQSHAPEVFINLFLSGTATRILLIGDATPLYYAPAVVWHSTWDRSPIAGALSEAADDVTAPGNTNRIDAISEPDNAAASIARAGVALGCTHIVVNQAEVERLSRDGWYDPAVTPAITRELIEAAMRKKFGLSVVFAWPERGQVLIAVSTVRP